MNKNQSLVADCIEFIRINTRISIATTTARVRQDDGASWDGIQLINGTLLVNPKYCHPGDLLHEAGHIVTVPMELRRWMNGWISGVASKLDGEQLDEFIYRSAFYRLDHATHQNPLLHMSDDQAATFWGCMALRSIGHSIKPMFRAAAFAEDSKDIHQTAEIHFRSPSPTGWGSAAMAYYAGLLESKRSIEPIAWDLGTFGRKKD
jgi:hypothetical protein